MTKGNCPLQVLFFFLLVNQVNKEKKKQKESFVIPVAFSKAEMASPSSVACTWLSEREVRASSIHSSVLQCPDETDITYSVPRAPHVGMYLSLKNSFVSFSMAPNLIQLNGFPSLPCFFRSPFSLIRTNEKARDVIAQMMGLSSTLPQQFRDQMVQ